MSQDKRILQLLDEIESEAERQRRLGIYPEEEEVPGYKRSPFLKRGVAGRDQEILQEAQTLVSGSDQGEAGRGLSGYSSTVSGVENIDDKPSTTYSHYKESTEVGKERSVSSHSVGSGGIQELPVEANAPLDQKTEMAAKSDEALIAELEVVQKIEQAKEANAPVIGGGLTGFVKQFGSFLLRLLKKLRGLVIDINKAILAILKTIFNDPITFAVVVITGYLIWMAVTNGWSEMFSGIPGLKQ